MKGIKHQFLKVLSRSHNADPYPKAFLRFKDFAPPIPTHLVLL